jgi:hypothetical protein
MRWSDVTPGSSFVDDWYHGIVVSAVPMPLSTVPQGYPRGRWIRLTYLLVRPRDNTTKLQNDTRWSSLEINSKDATWVWHA